MANKPSSNPKTKSTVTLDQRTRNILKKLVSDGKAENVSHAIRILACDYENRQ
jgi:Arc/MetJ-type ribon-helix-helix transcriptional regulator